MARNVDPQTTSAPKVDPAKKIEGLLGTPTSPGDIAKEQKPIDGPETAEAPMTGGSPGVIPDVTRDLLPKEPGFKTRASAETAAPVKQFRVTQGGHVMLDGVRVPMRVGKTVNHLTFDLDKLTAQGIRLEEIVDAKE